MQLSVQRSLFDRGPTSLDAAFTELSRRELAAGAWLEHQPGWLRGSDGLFETLLAALPWTQHRVRMYERTLDEPRLTAPLDAQAFERWPVLGDMAGALGARYGVVFRSCGASLYRDGADSVAWHGDRVGRERFTALVATVSLGERRRFLLREKGGGPSVPFELGRGDLLVMGGSCQRTHEHTVPKLAAAGPRICLSFRPWQGDPRYSGPTPGR